MLSIYATESVFFHRFAVSFVEWFANGVTSFPFLVFSLCSFVYPLFSIIQLTIINSVVLSCNLIGVLSVILVTRESQMVYACASIWVHSTNGSYDRASSRAPRSKPSVPSQPG